MSDTPSTIHRAQKNIRKKMQEGTVISFTTIVHPPKGFGKEPRTVGIIELDDGSKAIGQLTSSKVSIGQRVTPHMRLMRVNEQGLRTYDVCFEPMEGELIQEKEFTGYIIALTGPSGVGKTTISKILTTKVGDYAAKVPILTTREPSDQDEDEYEYIDPKKFEILKKQGRLASCSRIPSSTQSRWYGYRRSDIEAIWKEHKVPVVITEMGLLQDLVRTYSRRSILSFGLLPPGKSKRLMLSCLLHRLRTRGRDTDASIDERMKNAERDLDFFEQKKHLFDDLIVNDDLDSVVGLLKGRIMAEVRT
ncbi:MAG: OB-fold domain-containing protein [Candidatus Peribacteraceae bacterium]|jgi:guanylate kinase|nr:OB-fold domain-containing protein [Candidatus Peribacteraceae bacterium]HCI03823.1 hypothetical protein [Candidatus Peribacteria bacterium]|tara:strand:+ start:8953 stop:9867 length:915 start_codon:yes stop_codon:yes gene_type:complete